MGSVRKLLRVYEVVSKQYEPHKYNQNPTELRIQDIKGITRTILDCSGTPSWSWLLYMAYVISILNYMVYHYLYWHTPQEAAHGFTPTVAHLMNFEWWKPILILDDKINLPETREIFGYYAGPAPNKGAIDCSWVWTKEHGLLSRYVLRHANSPTYPNRHMVPVSGDIQEESSNFEPVNFISSNEVKYGTDGKLPEISYKYAIDKIHHVKEITDHNIIIGKTFLIPQG